MTTIRLFGLFLLIMRAVVLSGNEKDPALEKLQLIDSKIEEAKNKIDSINLVMDVMNDNMKSTNNDLLYKLDRLDEFAMENIVNKKNIDKLTSEKRALFKALYNDAKSGFVPFRDTSLESEYYKGYFDPDSADYDSSLCILPQKGIACNTGYGQIVYGFVNMHHRRMKCIVDFEKMNRIGVYSIFPETHGSIEMMFSYNKKVADDEIKKQLVKQSHLYNTKVDIVLSYYDWKSTNYSKPALHYGAVMLNMVDSLTSIINLYEFDGITIDFDIKQMDLKTLLLYKEFIFKMHKALKALKGDKYLNIVLSAEDFYDPINYSADQYGQGQIIQKSLLLKGKNISEKNEAKKIEKPRKNEPEMTRLQMLLMPDEIDYVNLLLINMDFSFIKNRAGYKSVCPIYGLQDNKNIVGIKALKDTLEKRIRGENIGKVVCVLPLYGNIWKIENEKIMYAPFIQKSFPHNDSLKNFKDDFKLLMDDSTVFIDDLSTNTMKRKFLELRDPQFAGMGIWNTEFGDSSLFDVLADVFNKPPTEKISPRLFMVRHCHWIRAFIGPNRRFLGAFLLCIIVMYVSFIAYVKIDGREKTLEKHKVAVVVTGAILVAFSYLYIITIPTTLGDKIESVVLLLIVGGLLLLGTWEFYKIQKSKSFP
jgi:hypothetical protein